MSSCILDGLALARRVEIWSLFGVITTNVDDRVGLAILGSACTILE